MTTEKNPGMRLFALQRNFDPEWTDEDFDRMARRAIGGLNWHPPVVWHRSFGIDLPGPATGFCVYESESMRNLKQQQQICWVPFTEVREVEEAAGAASGLGLYEPPAGTSLFLVERVFDAPVSLARVADGNRDAATDDVQWVRSYWDAERRHSRCLFAAPDAESVRDGLSEGTVTLLVPVLEDHPSAWVDIFDRAGVPRSWERETTTTERASAAV